MQVGTGHAQRHDGGLEARLALQMAPFIPSGLLTLRKTPAQDHSLDVTESSSHDIGNLSVLASNPSTLR